MVSVGRGVPVGPDPTGCGLGPVSDDPPGTTCHLNTFCTSFLDSVPRKVKSPGGVVDVGGGVETKTPTTICIGAKPLGFFVDPTVGRLNEHGRLWVGLLSLSVHRTERRRPVCGRPTFHRTTTG